MAVLEKSIILVGLQADGTTYSLHPAFRRRLLEAYPTVRPAPSVFVGSDTKVDFESLHGPMWKQIAILLTGLSLEKLTEFGQVIVRDPMSGREFELQANG